MSTTHLAYVLILLLCCCHPAGAWSNGGYSDDPANPDYGTHDWIAQHALDLLPAREQHHINEGGGNSVGCVQHTGIRNDQNIQA